MCCATVHFLLVCSRWCGNRDRDPLQSRPWAGQGFPHNWQDWRRYSPGLNSYTPLRVCKYTRKIIFCSKVDTVLAAQKTCVCVHAAFLWTRDIQLGVPGWGSDARWEERDVRPEAPHPNQPSCTHRRRASVPHCCRVSPGLLCVLWKLSYLFKHWTAVTTNYCIRCSYRCTDFLQCLLVVHVTVVVSQVFKIANQTRFKTVDSNLLKDIFMLRQNCVRFKLCITSIDTLMACLAMHSFDYTNVHFYLIIKWLK